MWARPAAYVSFMTVNAVNMLLDVLSGNTDVEICPEASSTAINTVKFPSSMSDFI
jgi:hypothetical protein